MNRFFGIVIVFLFPSCLQAINAQEEPKGGSAVQHKAITGISKEGEVQCNVGLVPTDLQLIPALHLSDALKEDKKSIRFRVSWRSSNVGYGFNATAAYDREKRTLRFYSRGHYGSNDLTEYRIDAVVEQVTDEVVDALANSNGGKVYSEDEKEPRKLETAGFTDFIATFGAKIISVKQTIISRS